MLLTPQPPPPEACALVQGDTFDLFLLKHSGRSKQERARTGLLEEKSV